MLFDRVEDCQRMVALLPFGVEAIRFDGQQRMTVPFRDLHGPPYG